METPAHVVPGQGRPHPFCLLVFFGGIAAKFWLMAGAQISDGGDDPREYVNQVLHPANEGVAYGPGTGMVGRFFHDLAIPFRSGIEILFILALVLAIRALFAWPWKTRTAAGLFLFLLFDPAPPYLFSTFMSDQVWLVETMAGLALFVLALDSEDRPRWWLLALGAICLGLSAITRSILAPLVLDLAALAAVSFFLLCAKPPSFGLRRSLAILALAFWTLALGIGCVYGATCWYNARCFGYSGISALDSREYKTFYLRLQSVGAPTGVRYFPIDADRRKLIAEAGPASAWFMREIEKEEKLKDVGLRNYGRSDFPTGWIHFAIFDVVLRATHGNLRQSFAIFRAIENEISAAGKAGRIPVHAIVPLPDRRLALVLPALPEAWQKTVVQIAYEPPPDWRGWQMDHATYINPDFTRALHRGPAHASRAQKTGELLLGQFYTALYRPFWVYVLGFVGAVFVLVVVMRWRLLPSFTLASLARPSFAFTFVVMLLWYALFDASGLPVLSRYMIFNHLLLPLLLVYYLREIVRLVRAGPLPLR